MNSKEWVKDQVKSIFEQNDEEVVSIAYVKALLIAIGDEFDKSKINPKTGGVRSPIRNPRLSKSQRQAAAMRDAEVDLETGTKKEEAK